MQALASCTADSSRDYVGNRNPNSLAYCWPDKPTTPAQIAVIQWSLRAGEVIKASYFWGIQNDRK